MSEDAFQHQKPLDSSADIEPVNWKSRAILAGIALLAALLLAGIGLAIVSMVNHPGRTENFRDIVIIFMAGEALIIGMALIILIIQLAQLTALLQNEIKPILDSTSETVNTLRGTTTFLSDNLVKPVVKANSSIAALRRVFDLIRSSHPR